jgi:hypothetical protein
MNPIDLIPHTLLELLTEAELRCLIEDLGSQQPVLVGEA